MLAGTAARSGMAGTAIDRRGDLVISALCRFGSRLTCRLGRGPASHPAIHRCALDGPRGDCVLCRMVRLSVRSSARTSRLLAGTIAHFGFNSGASCLVPDAGIECVTVDAGNVVWGDPVSVVDGALSGD